MLLDANENNLASIFNVMFRVGLVLCFLLVIFLCFLLHNSIIIALAVAVAVAEIYNPINQITKTNQWLKVSTFIFSFFWLTSAFPDLCFFLETRIFLVLPDLDLFHDGQLLEFGFGADILKVKSEIFVNTLPY